MLQFITDSLAPAAIPAQVSAAIEGGCRWIQLSMPGADKVAVHNMAVELIPMCRDTDTILVIESHKEVVDELKVSGILLSSAEDAASVREQLGPHAIVGVSARSAADIIALKGLDIDYAMLGPVFPTPGADFLRETVGAVRAAGIEMPVVAFGGVTRENAVEAVKAGASGVAISRAIARAPLPAVYTAETLDVLASLR